MTATGDADVLLKLGGRVACDDAHLQSVGEAVAPTLFPAARARAVSVDQNGGGSSLIRVHIDGVFVPSEQPAVTIDTGAALEALPGAGYPAVDIDVQVPTVATVASWDVAPTTTQPHAWMWGAVRVGAAPTLTVALQPSVAVGYAKAVGDAVAVLGALAAASLSTCPGRSSSRPAPKRRPDREAS